MGPAQLSIRLSVSPRLWPDRLSPRPASVICRCIFGSRLGSLSSQLSASSASSDSRSLSFLLGMSSSSGQLNFEFSSLSVLLDPAVGALDQLRSRLPAGVAADVRLGGPASQLERQSRGCTPTGPNGARFRQAPPPDRFGLPPDRLPKNCLPTDRSDSPAFQLPVTTGIHQ